MLRRLIAIALMAVACLSVFMPLAAAVQTNPMPACCRRGAHHHCTCCTHNTSGESDPGFRDASRSCPCFSPRTTRTMRGGLSSPLAFTLRSPALETVSAISALSFHSITSIHHSERGPPGLQG